MQSTGPWWQLGRGQLFSPGLMLHLTDITLPIIIAVAAVLLMGMLVRVLSRRENEHPNEPAELLLTPTERKFFTVLLQAAVRLWPVRRGLPCCRSLFPFPGFWVQAEELRVSPDFVWPRAVRWRQEWR